MLGKKETTRMTTKTLNRSSALQAVVVADSYNRRFDPLTHSTPRVLLPLCNVPLIDYVLRLLYTNGVSEVFVVARTNADQIHQHLEQVSPQYKSMKISCIMSQGSYNFGDALRDLNTRQLIDSNFILVTGDIVSNYKLHKVIEEHKQRADTDSDFLMTMLMTQCDHEHPVRSIEEDYFIVVDPDDDRLLAFESTTDSLEVPINRIIERNRSELRYDLVCSNIFICTPLMLMQFADNFDYASVFDLIKGVLGHDDVVAYKIHTAVSPKYYATRCANLTSYDAISQDVMNRWTYPLCPDLFSPSSLRYEYKRNNIYIQSSCILGRTCRLLGTVIVGENSRIGLDDGDMTTLRSSVVGNNCVIGAGSTFTNAYLMDNVTIGDSCVIDHALIGKNAIIYDNVVIPHGCIIGEGVKLGPNIALEKHTRMSVEPQLFRSGSMSMFVEYDDSLANRNRQLSTVTEREEDGAASDTDSPTFSNRPYKTTASTTDHSDLGDYRGWGDDRGDDSGDDETFAPGVDPEREHVFAEKNEAGYDLHIVGADGCGHAFVPELGQHESKEHTLWKEMSVLQHNMSFLCDASPQSPGQLEEEGNDEDTDSLADLHDDIEAEDSIDEEFEEFCYEISEIFRAHVKPNKYTGAQVDMIKVEITGSRAAHSMSPADVLCAIIRGIISNSVAIHDEKRRRVHLLQLFALLSPIMKSYIDTKTEQTICIQNIMEFCLENQTVTQFFVDILNTLYNKEVIEEEAILSWYSGRDDEDTDDESAKLFVQAKPFIDWLEEAETESEDDDDA